MTALRQDHSYGLSGAQINKNTSLYFVKLTDTAIRTLESYQNLKTSPSNQPAICFQENQGYIKIPAPTPDYPDATRIFRFKLSSDSKETPQSSFDCIRQEGKDHLESKGSIQGKITVCATEESYQTTRERLSQVETDSRRHSAIEIKPGPSGSSGRSSNSHSSSHSSSSSSSSSSRHSLFHKRSQVLSTVARRSVRDQIIHLLRKQGRMPGSSSSSSNNSSSINNRSSTTSSSSSSSRHSLLHKRSEVLSTVARCPKRPLPLDLSNDRNPKRQKSSVQPVSLQMPSHGAHGTNPTHSSFHGTSGNTAYLHKGHQGEKATVTLPSRTPLPDYVQKYGTITTPEQRQQYEEEFDATYDKYHALHHQIAAASQMFVQLSSKLDTLPPGTEAYKRMQDHVLEKYRNYQKRCPAYRGEKKKCVYLHHKLAHLKERITAYDQAQETRRMQDHVLEKYRSYQKRFPAYRKEKKKCVYLHHKLAHLKDRITAYDQAQETRV